MASANQSIYLDDCVSDATVSGNVLTGLTGYDAFVIHGGANNVISGNVIDLTTYGGFIGAMDNSAHTCRSGSDTGNVWAGNLVLSKGAAGGYTAYSTTLNAQPTIGGTGSPPANDYYNYGTGTLSSSGVNGTTVNDTNPQATNPQFSGCYAIAVGSAVFPSPINFPPLPMNWGSPGFTIPNTEAAGSKPSYASPTC